MSIATGGDERVYLTELDGATGTGTFVVAAIPMPSFGIIG